MNSIIEPTNCPTCDSALVKINDQLFCKNTACGAQLQGKLVHFCKVLGIKGMGPKTLEKLGLGSVAELFYLDTDLLTPLLGEKTAVKLLDEISRSKAASLATVLEALAIPLVGGSAAGKLASVVGSLEEITEEACKAAGLGEKVTSNILEWREYEYPELAEFLPFKFDKVVNTDNNVKATVCITGKLTSYKKKSDAESDLLKAGYKLVDSVTKSLDFLVDEGGGTSAKRKKAEQYGITIITDLNDLLKENINDRS